MPKSPSPYIHHIVDAATQIQEYLLEINQYDFSRNQLVQDAVIRQLEIIGEACANLEEEFKDSRPNIPWKGIVGMRNRLTHEYWDVDTEVVWQTVTTDVPALKKQLLELLSEIGK